MSTRADAFQGWSFAGSLVPVASLGCALMLGACSQASEFGFSPAESSLGAKQTASVGPQTELEKATQYWGKELSKNPHDDKAALAYARNLKALGRKQDALGVLQASYLHNSDNRELLSEYGRLALEMGQVGTADKLLERADDPAKPDWRILSARGTVQAKQGQYKEAINYFERARAMAPGQSSIVSNLAMAYTMDGHAAKGESLLRQAAEDPAADPRIKQNLALVIGLQGKSTEAQGSSEARTAAAALSADNPDTWIVKVSADSSGGSRTSTPLTTASTAKPKTAR